MWVSSKGAPDRGSGTRIREVKGIIMTNKLAAKFTVAMHNMRETARQSERGASALEYIGMVLVAAFLVGAVYLALSGEGADIKGKVKSAVDAILKGPA